MDFQQLSPAWIVFSGTGALEILNSFNVDSLTDNGAGDYTITWSNPFALNPYAFSSACGGNMSGGDGWVALSAASNITTSSLRIQAKNAAGSGTDAAIVCVLTNGE